MPLILRFFCKRCQGLPRLLGSLLAVLVAAAPGRAATIVKVHKNQDQLLLALSAQELKNAQNDRRVFLRIAKLELYVGGAMALLNADKKTVVVELDAPDPRLEPNQSVTFLPLFWNAAASPLVTSVAQYHDGTSSFVEGDLGAFYSASSDKVGDDSGHVTASGTRLLAHGYVNLAPTPVGLGLDYERRNAHVYFHPAGSASNMTLMYDRLAPSIWVEATGNLRLALRYEYTVMVQAYRGFDNGNYQFSLGQPVATLLWSVQDSEAGVDYTSGHRAGASTQQVHPGQDPVLVHKTYKAPNELALHLRTGTSSLFIWGARAAYLFYDRGNGPGQELDPRPSPAQLLHLETSFEHRWNGGSKFDWILAYDGGKYKTLATTDLGANEGSLQLMYQTPLTEQWSWGGVLAMGGGVAVLDDRRVQADGSMVAVQRHITAWQTSFMLEVNREVGALLSKKERRF